MDTKLTKSLPTWVAPRLMRLNQADGTDKHLLITESFATSIPGPTECGGSDVGSGGDGVCGPS